MDFLKSCFSIQMRINHFFFIQIWKYTWILSCLKKENLWFYTKLCRIMGPRCLIEYVTLLHLFFDASDLPPMSLCAGGGSFEKKSCWIKLTFCRYSSNMKKRIWWIIKMLTLREHTQMSPLTRFEALPFEYSFKNILSSIVLIIG